MRSDNCWRKTSETCGHMLEHRRPMMPTGLADHFLAPHGVPATKR